MDQALLLLGLRFLSALLLLGFVGMLAWFSYQDMRAVALPAGKPLTQNAYLEVLATAGARPPIGAQLLLLPVTTIGRAATSTIVLEDNYASGEHALLALRGDHWLLEDRRSRNGTLLNDQPVTDPVVIAPGDVITIGDTQLRLGAAP